MKRTALGIALVVILVVLWTALRVHMLSNRFGQLKLGDSRQRVVQLLGKPRSIGKCGEPFGNPGGKPGCVEDYLYASPYAPFVPEYWSVSFDKEGNVIDTAHYVSP